MMTLLFAGHDTTTATVAFLFYELARHPEIADVADDPQLLDQALDETLRLYPPAWIGPRRAAREFEFAGHRIAEGARGQLLLVGLAPAARRVAGAATRSARSASHPRRASASPRAPTSRSAAARGSASGCASARPRSAPSRRAVERALPRRVAARLPLRIRQTPTLGPAGGLPVRIRV